VLLAGAIEVNALAQGVLRQCTQWLWIEHPTFQLGGGNFTPEQMPPHNFLLLVLSSTLLLNMQMHKE